MKADNRGLTDGREMLAALAIGEWRGGLRSVRDNIGDRVRFVDMTIRARDLVTSAWINGKAATDTK